MALIIVLIVLVLIATLASEVATTAVTNKRVAEHSMNDFLLRTSVLGRRQVLRSVLTFDRLEDARQNKVVDTEDEQWAWSKHDGLSEWTGNDDQADAGTGTAYRSTDSDLLAWCEDEQGKLNVRGFGTERSENARYTHTRETLIRVIDLYREPWSDLDLSESEASEMVDELEEFLWSEADDEDNPEPPTADKWRLLSLDDLLRIPGEYWTAAVLFDVRNPEATEAELAGREFERERRDEDEESDLEGGRDDQWFRPNGVPGLSRYLTLYAPPGQQPGTTYTINLNTAPYVLVKALFDDGEDHLGEAIIDHRRQGAGATDEDTGAEDEEGAGYFEDVASLAKVEGLNEDTWREDHPRLSFFADVKTEIFSVHVIATVVTHEGFEDEDEEDIDQDELDAAPVQILASYQYHEVVHRDAEGKLKTLLVERRNDPVFPD